MNIPPIGTGPVSRTAPGYRLDYAVFWIKRPIYRNGLSVGRQSRPCLMLWALTVAHRMRARGHTVRVIRV